MAAFLVRILAWFGSSLAFKVLSSLGLGLTSIYFINSLLDKILQSLSDSLGGLPANSISFLGLAGFDKYLSIVLGAAVTATYLRTLKPIFSAKE